MTTDLYAFVFRGMLAEEALDRAGRLRGVAGTQLDEEIAAALSIEMLDPVHLASARQMATVYAAVAAFENSVREFMTRLLAEAYGDTWWEQGFTSRMRTGAEKRRDEEIETRWHATRGENPINYTDLLDLSEVIVNPNHWPIFEPYLRSADWVRADFDVINRSRRVIMHSGVLEPKDMERLGISIRDWVRQVSV